MEGNATPDNPSKLKIVEILDPLLCVGCNNAWIADIIDSTGSVKKMFYCSKLDCDNWITRPE